MKSVIYSVKATYSAKNTNCLYSR